MLRRLFTFASVLSLLLSVATAVLWVRSYSCHDAVEFGTSHGLVELRTFRSSFLLDNEPQRQLDHRWAKPLIDKLELLKRRQNTVDEYLRLSSLGLRYIKREPQSWSHSIQCRTILLGCAVLPATWTASALWLARRRKRRHDLTLCPTCGYDLTGNTSGTCPECGTAIPRGSEAGA